VIPGDSGSAVYNTKGEIVGIVTYLDRSVEPSGAVGFTLSFTPKELGEAAAFNGVKTPSPTYRTKHSEPPVNPFQFFFGR
jgi:hypothetical protein